MSFNITEEQFSFIKEKLPEVLKYLDGEDINDLLLAIDSIITSKGMNQDGELNSFGLKAQLLYDQIFNQN